MHISRQTHHAISHGKRSVTQKTPSYPNDGLQIVRELKRHAFALSPVGMVGCPSRHHNIYTEKKTLKFI